MSRSYRQPWCKLTKLGERFGEKHDKQRANRKVRHAADRVAAAGEEDTPLPTMRSVVETWGWNGEGVKVSMIPCRGSYFHKTGKKRTVNK